MIFTKEFDGISVSFSVTFSGGEVHIEFLTPDSIAGTGGSADKNSTDPISSGPDGDGCVYTLTPSVAWKDVTNKSQISLTRNC